MDFSKGEKNPLDVVKFFDEYDSEASFKGKARTMDIGMLPANFQVR